MLYPDIEIEPNDEILTAKDLGRLAKQSSRWGQKQFETGEIPSFLRGRERVTLRSWWQAYLRELIAAEVDRQKHAMEG